MQIIAYPMVYEGDIASLSVVQTTGGPALHISRENMSLDLIDGFLAANKQGCQWVLLKKPTKWIEYQPVTVEILNDRSIGKR